MVRDDGPFNFSALCNKGAAAATGEFLLFLNNDTEVLQADWLDRLVELAALPDVGAVGARLLYPDVRVQHAGVVLGLGGVAGHFGAREGRDAPGWLGGDIVPHEVSAVTGACLMVGRTKFMTVGGFDQVVLPIELNDIDLCLRLANAVGRPFATGERSCRTDNPQVAATARSCFRKSTRANATPSSRAGAPSFATIHISIPIYRFMTNSRASPESGAGG